MKAGVSAWPCASVSRPRRACRSRASTSKRKLILNLAPTLVRPVQLRSSAFDQHGIPIAEETVSFSDGVAVGMQDMIDARKRTHQHQQRRARQMEVGDQPIHHAEVETRMNEDIRLALFGAKCA